MLPDLDEYPAQALIAAALPKLAQDDPSLRENAESPKNFQKIISAACRLWAQGDLDGDSESFDDFSSRVRRAIARMREVEGSGKRVIAFTSGGPIGMAVQQAMEAPPLKGLELSWLVRNAPLTAFLFSGDRLTLSGFNETPHLSDAGLLTYR